MAKVLQACTITFTAYWATFYLGLMLLLCSNCFPGPANVFDAIIALAILSLLGYILHICSLILSLIRDRKSIAARHVACFVIADLIYLIVVYLTACFLESTGF